LDAVIQLFVVGYSSFIIIPTPTQIIRSGFRKELNMYLQGWFLVHNTLKITSARILCMELVGADLLFLLRSWPNPGKKSKSSEAPMLNETCWGRLGKHLGEYFVRMSFLLLTCGLYGGSIFPACAGVDMVLCET